MNETLNTTIECKELIKFLLDGKNVKVEVLLDSIDPVATVTFVVGDEYRTYELQA